MDDLSSCERTNNWGHREERWRTDERRKKLQDYEIPLFRDRFGDEVKRGLWQHFHILDDHANIDIGLWLSSSGLMLLSADSNESQNDNQRLSNLAQHNVPDGKYFYYLSILIRHLLPSSSLSWVKPLPRYQLTRSTLSGGNLKSSLGDHKVVTLLRQNGNSPQK